MDNKFNSLKFYIKKSFFLHLWCILNVFKAEALGDHVPKRFEWGRYNHSYTPEPQFFTPGMFHF
jgi:hypothetical protein